MDTAEQLDREHELVAWCIGAMTETVRRAATTTDREAIEYLMDWMMERDAWDERMTEWRKQILGLDA